MTQSISNDGHNRQNLKKFIKLLSAFKTIPTIENFSNYITFLENNLLIIAKIFTASESSLISLNMLETIKKILTSYPFNELKDYDIKWIRIIYGMMFHHDLAVRMLSLEILSLYTTQISVILNNTHEKLVLQNFKSIYINDLKSFIIPKYLDILSSNFKSPLKYFNNKILDLNLNFLLQCLEIFLKILNQDILVSFTVFRSIQSILKKTCLLLQSKDEINHFYRCWNAFLLIIQKGLLTQRKHTKIEISLYYPFLAKPFTLGHFNITKSVPNHDELNDKDQREIKNEPLCLALITLMTGFDSQSIFEMLQNTWDTLTLTNFIHCILHCLNSFYQTAILNNCQNDFCHEETEIKFIQIYQFCGSWLKQNQKLLYNNNYAQLQVLATEFADQMLQIYVGLQKKNVLINCNHDNNNNINAQTIDNINKKTNFISEGKYQLQKLFDATYDLWKVFVAITIRSTQINLHIALIGTWNRLFGLQCSELFYPPKDPKYRDDMINIACTNIIMPMPMSESHQITKQITTVPLSISDKDILLLDTPEENLKTIPNKNESNLITEELLSTESIYNSQIIELKKSEIALDITQNANVEIQGKIIPTKKSFIPNNDTQHGSIDDNTNDVTCFAKENNIPTTISSKNILSDNIESTKTLSHKISLQSVLDAWKKQTPVSHRIPRPCAKYMSNNGKNQNNNLPQNSLLINSNSLSEPKMDVTKKKILNNLSPSTFSANVTTFKHSSPSLISTMKRHIFDPYPMTTPSAYSGKNDNIIPNVLNHNSSLLPYTKIISTPPQNPKPGILKRKYAHSAESKPKIMALSSVENKFEITSLSNIYHNELTFQETTPNFKKRIRFADECNTATTHKTDLNTGENSSLNLENEPQKHKDNFITENNVKRNDNIIVENMSLIDIDSINKENNDNIDLLGNNVIDNGNNNINIKEFNKNVCKNLQPTNISPLRLTDVTELTLPIYTNDDLNISQLPTPNESVLNENDSTFLYISDMSLPLTNSLDENTQQSSNFTIVNTQENKSKPSRNIRVTRHSANKKILFSQNVVYTTNTP